jgi:hypothetical protein
LKRRLLVAFAFSATTIALYAACKIDSIEFAPSDSGAHPDDAALDVDENVDPNGKDAEAGLVDAEQLDANSIDANCCDCDDDKFIGIHDAALGCGTPPADEIDCDDYNKAIKPDAGFVQNPVWSSSWPTPFDWNCDTKVTRQLDYNLECSGTVKSCKSAAGTGSGFENDPACGTTQTYFDCPNVAGVCSNLQPTTPQTQACK